jgi:hypothetical protein
MISLICYAKVKTTQGSRFLRNQGTDTRYSTDINPPDKGVVGSLAQRSQPKVLSVGKYDLSPYTSLDLTYPGFAGFIYGVCDTPK